MRSRPLISLGLLLVVALVVALPARAIAQEFRWEQADELGVSYRVMHKLERVPLKLHGDQPNLRARYKPGSEGDYIWGSQGKYAWYLWVYEFYDPERTGRTVPMPLPGGAVGDTTPQDFATSFERFVGKSEGRGEFRHFVVEGEQHKKNSAKGKKLPYAWWEYTDTQASQIASLPQTWYVCAAVYDLGDREIALVTSIPVEKAGKLEPKYRSWVKTMLLSLSQLKSSRIEATADEAPSADDLFRFCDTPERRLAVEQARANIAALEGWDVFTTRHYIVLYSWPNKRPEKRRKHQAEATELADHMDRMRDLYAHYYPAPLTLVFPYSVLRICSDRGEFRKYGGPDTRDLLGWFSPKSKELVLFNEDVERARTVAFHEGWHQYSDTYFGEATALPRWFDEGTGDFFGAFRWVEGRWRYEVSRMRKADVKALVTAEQFVPLNEILTWSTARFYDGETAAYYAQSYAMVDFLMRGRAERAAGWDQRWDDILPSYCEHLLAGTDGAVAARTAFADVDWDAFTRAWSRWVRSF